MTTTDAEPSEQQTHIVPVGFEYDRLIAPLIRDQISVDRVILLQGAVGSEGNVEYSKRLAGKLETDFRNLLGATTERMTVEDVYDYDGAFELAFDCITAELDAGNEVWVNISSMPRPVSFAFATAAHSVMVEHEADRERIHTYYTAPEKYLETELAEELRTQIEILETLQTESGAEDTPRIDSETIDQRLDAAQDLLTEFDERGATIGAKEIDGSHVQELPVAPFSNIKPFEELILFTLGDHGEFDSISDLAETLARELDEEYTDSFRSKVIYNVDRLGPGGVGYVDREAEGKSYRISLSRIGELWVRSHSTA
ncbi:HFX_2341 family transcriptional regulator [Halodesulfurarchaeum sp.]|uniref:HFX_2341 family transcriptional regulator n=1 Tax=Halodesulfurarchaeum sp. TaxID=1980530 RepID=UPI001BC2DE8A|nr:aspartate kinase [Halodesulfurarchaeum sp.]